jgi:hypothetical protein
VSAPAISKIDAASVHEADIMQNRDVPQAILPWLQNLTAASKT